MLGGQESECQDLSRWDSSLLQGGVLLKISIPISESRIRSLEIGDIVFLDGAVHTGRDEMHLRYLEYVEESRAIPVDLEGGVLFHCGPLVVKRNGWELIAAGPTTSARMNGLEPRFIEASGVRGIIGKGGMSRPTVNAMKEHGCVYFSMTGGAAVLAAEGIKKVEGVEWLDLGVPEALWILEVENLGPLTVAIDAHGNSLYEGVEREVENKLPEIRKKLGLE